MADIDWDSYGHIMASEYREKILLSLYEKPKTPKQLQEELGYHLSHVSNTLTDLSEYGLVECLTEDRKRGRVYDLTEKGIKMTEQIKK